MRDLFNQLTDIPCKKLIQRDSSRTNDKRLDWMKFVAKHTKSFVVSPLATLNITI